MSSKNRRGELDLARCLGNYMIVLLHGMAAFQYVDQSTVEFAVGTFVCSHLAWMAIPTFFLISGYLLFLQFDFANCLAKIGRRVRRLAIPYLCWNVLFVVFYLCLSRFVPRLSTRVTQFGLDTFSGAVVKIVSLTVAPIDGPLWFIRALLLFSLASPVLWFLMKIGKGIPAIVLTMLWCAAEGLVRLAPELEFIAPSYAFACFLIGGALAVNGVDLVRAIRGYWLLVGLAACAVRAALKMFAPAVAMAPAGMVLLSLLAVVEAPALIAAVKCLNVVKMSENAFYQFMREMSFFAYAGHFLFCSIWLHALAPHLGGFWDGKFTLLVFVFVACGLITIAAVFMLGRRFCPRMLKLLDGSL